jgi:hypothetical protein
MNPASSPQDAIKEGLVVPHPLRATANEIAARLELDPTSSHLLVGGIGSGKTTQLLLACERLRAVADTRAYYIDVSVYHDLSHLKPGTLIVTAGLALSPKGGIANKTVLAARTKFEQWAHGYTRWIEAEPDWDDDPSNDYDNDPGDFYPEHEPPLLSSPDIPQVNSSVEEKAATLLLLGQNGPQKHIVLLFDALDRVSDLDAFADLVEQDVQALSNVGVGVVIVGPLRSVFGAHRPIVDRFQHFYSQGPIDVQRNGMARQFILHFLQERDTGSLFTEPARERVAEWSGGVLRDAITLARSAGEHAYLAGADQVTPADVDAAADAFGRQLLFGLNSREVELLQRVRKAGSFVPTTADDLLLLVTCRVLEYAGVTSRFAVHPTIAPLLASVDAEGDVA